MNAPDCLLCGATATVVYERHPGYQKPTTFDIAHCAKCNTSFSLPRTDADGIYELIYTNGPRVMWYDRYWHYAEEVKLARRPLAYLAETEDTYWAVREALGMAAAAGKKTRVLEIGSGLGYLTYSLQREGFDAKGLDISKEAVTRAVDNFGDLFICADIYEYAKKNQGAYDAVVFTELIEHINEIMKFIPCVKTLLAENGRIIFTTPNKSAYPADAVWATDLPPVHCWWLSEESVKYIASTVGMKPSFVDFSEYYSTHYRVILKDDAYRVPIMQPWFDPEGNLLNISKLSEARGLRLIARALFRKSRLFMVLRRTIGNMIIQFRNRGKSLVRCSSRGPVLCAILEKASS